MITAEKTITVNIAVFAKNIDMLTDLVSTIRNDCISVVRHYEKENSEELQVHLRNDSKCGHCGKAYPECECGRPHRSPAV